MKKANSSVLENERVGERSSSEQIGGAVLPPPHHVPVFLVYKCRRCINFAVAYGPSMQHTCAVLTNRSTGEACAEKQEGMQVPLPVFQCEVDLLCKQHSRMCSYRKESVVV